MDERSKFLLSYSSLEPGGYNASYLLDGTLSQLPLENFVTEKNPAEQQWLQIDLSETYWVVEVALFNRRGTWRPRMTSHWVQ